MHGEKTMNEDRMTKEEFLANRKTAGQVIDVETCRVWEEYSNFADPYGLEPVPDDFNPDAPDLDQNPVGKAIWVGSLEHGAVFVDDLPEDKRRALHARLDRANHTPRTAEGVRDVLVEEYNLAVAALDDVIYDLVSVTDCGGRFPGVPCDVIRCGVRLALAKLGKEDTPLDGALERKLRRYEQDRLRYASIIYRETAE
jgi:hypothetical protein